MTWIYGDIHKGYLIIEEILPFQADTQDYQLFALYSLLSAGKLFHLPFFETISSLPSTLPHNLCAIFSVIYGLPLKESCQKSAP